MPFPDDLDPSGLLAEPKGGDNSPPLSVGELSGALKRTVELAFDRVRVRGEISGWKRHSSGHCYFTLKDDAACIDAVMWKGQAASLAFRPEDGAEVIVTGKLTTYPGRSKYQVVVARMELAGEGALMALLDKRRRMLAAEGLFDEARKRALPYLPRTIGVVTSPTGAVIRDILHRLADRFPSHVIVWPVPVQGDGAAARVAAAIRGFGALAPGGAVPRPDLIIVARGGGSVEDLWAFNEEEVVRAAAESPIPLISAVGHETDTTLIDHAADRRAPTPTAAAEMAVPVRAELAAWLAELHHRQTATVTRTAARAAERHQQLAERWPDPAALVASFSQRLDDSGDRLPRALGQRAAHARADLAEVAPRLQPRLIERTIAAAHQRLVDLRLPDPRRVVADAAARLDALWRLAELAHPERPLSRGYVRVTAGDGRTIVSADQARREATVALHFADGMVPAAISGVSAAASKPDAPKTPDVRNKVERARSKPYLSGRPPQPGLFDAEE